MSGETLSPAELALIQALRGLDYGAVEATVHDGRIVRIERREKLRLDGDPTAGTPAAFETTDLQVRPKERSARGKGPRGSR
jgi:hypothetical protein